MRKGDYKDYRITHQGPNSWAKNYDEILFNQRSYDYLAWQREKKILNEIISKHLSSRDRCLDFACGTGRVLSYLEGRFRESIGIDISEDMIKSARSKVKKSQLICGDVTKDPYIVSGKFDCITAFRFFLHAQRSLRDDVMKFLSRRLRGDDSILVFNIHGNKFSTRWFVVALDRIRGKQNSHMSISDVKRLVSKYGLEIVEYYGVNYLDKSIYNYTPKLFWHSLEYLLRPLKFLKPFSVYIVYVCKKARA